MKTLIAILLILAVTGCGSLSKHEQAQYSAWEESEQLIKEKKPQAALWLGLLPGGGSWYTNQYALGFADLLLWPISAFWDGPNAMLSAYRRNYEATAAAYPAMVGQSEVARSQ